MLEPIGILIPYPFGVPASTRLSSLCDGLRLPEVSLPAHQTWKGYSLPELHLALVAMVLNEKCAARGRGRFWFCWRDAAGRHDLYPHLAYEGRAWSGAEQEAFWAAGHVERFAAAEAPWAGPAADAAVMAIQFTMPDSWRAPLVEAPVYRRGGPAGAAEGAVIIWGGDRALVCRADDMPDGLPCARMACETDAGAEARELRGVARKWFQNHEARLLKHVLEDVEQVACGKGRSVWIRGHELRELLGVKGKLEGPIEVDSETTSKIVQNEEC